MRLSIHVPSLLTKLRRLLSSHSPGPPLLHRLCSLLQGLESVAYNDGCAYDRYALISACWSRALLGACLNVDSNGILY
ncbi:hypothetical protein PISMIDRAFT_685211 [Pisolithus microcarpus 441]|uniref:Uncharacterized protein n=1 Tax=Pisolithus microcarpus 441 TaxID=765257 RepID=A0A0C9ZBY5_9AGAM|nr:hypothetical protein PISMIDRAFT_685211 [Pisolithus microcarpus 441]